MSAQNIVASQNRKNKTIHTRKEVITIFEELKNKINIAYQSLTEESFSILLTVIKIMYYLHPMPKFLIEVNQIGSIPVTAFLENLLIKTNMTKLKIMPTLRNWVITLLLQFNEAIPKLKVSQIKQIKQKKFQLYSEWNEDIILSFINADFSAAIKRRDVGTVAIIVHFLRVYVIYSQQNKTFTIEKQDFKWKMLITNLVEGSKILDNLKRQQISVCICYYLCLKERFLSHEAIESGVIHYLILTLNREHISSYFGKKIIQFLKFLLLQLDSRYHGQINIPVFQHALGLFSSRFDREQIIISIRDLINIFQQKISVIDYQEKLERLTNIYSQISNSKIIPETFFEALHIINLYIHNERMGNLLVKNYEPLFSKILYQQSNPQVIKMVTGFLSYNFKKGKFQQQVAFQITRKIYQIINNDLAREVLIENRKKFLIDFVKNLKMLLSNRQHHQQVVKCIQGSQIQAKLWNYSDCTNYMYQKELIELKRLLGSKGINQNVNKQVQVLTTLQAQIINKSRFNLNKLSYELFQQIKFMQILINQNGILTKKFNPSPQLATVLSNYIQTTSHKSNFALLQNIQNEQNDQLRKQFNLVCTKLLTSILKTNQNSKQMQAVKDKIISLTTSKDQIDDVYQVINSFFQIEESAIQQTQQKLQKSNKNVTQPQQNSLKNQFLQKIRQLLIQYFKLDEHFDISLLKVNNNEDLAIVIEQLNNYQNQADILKYLKIIFELTKKDNICLEIYRMISAKLIVIYQALISRQAGGDKEIVQVLDSIFLRFIKSHIKSLYSDNYDSQSINYYFQIVAEIDNYFQFGFSNKRIELLQLMIEYFQCNVIECHAEYQKLIRKQDRSEIIRSNIDNNKAESIGLSYGKLLFLNSDDEVHQAFWMMHKQHIIRGLNDNRDNVCFLKFIQIYFSQCQRFIYKEYQLQTLIQIIIQLFNKQCENMDVIQGYLSEGILKLRKIKYFSNILQTFIERQELKSNKNMLYSQQQVLSKAMILLIQNHYAIRELNNQSFKKFYIQQIIVILIKTLTKLYKNNFIDKQIRSEYLVQYFDQLMQLNNQHIIVSSCQLMRIFLLKKFFSMADCASLRTCQNYIDSLPPQAQQHISACNRIESLLAVDQSLQEQNKLFFLSNPQQEEEQNNQFEKFATDFLRTNSDVNGPQILNIVQNFQPQEQIKKFQEPIPILQIPIQQQKNNEIPELKELVVQKVLISQVIQKVLSPQQLLDAIKTILAQPSNQSIKKLSSQLYDMQSLQYCQLLMELFLLSPTIYSQDISPSKLTLEQVQKSIIKHIPAGVCPLDSKYYQILQKNQIGAQICLKKKGGLKATQILCQKIMYNTNQDEFCTYVYLLGKNMSSNNEFRYINNIKVYQPINSKLPKITKNMQNLSKISKFITQTSQYPALRANYQAPSVLSKALLEQPLDLNTKIDVITALASLTNDCHKHKKIAESTKIVNHIASILKQQPQNQPLFIQSAHLLSNIIDYSESLIPQSYQLLGLQELIVKILNEQVQKAKYSVLIQSCLKILDFLSKNLQSTIKILKTSFPTTLVTILKLSTQNNQNENVGIQINIIANIIKHTETTTAQTLQDLQAAGLIQFLNLASPFVPKVKKSQIFLETISITLTVPDMIKKFMGNNKQILNILTEILKHNQSQMGIIEKWTKLICQLFENPKFLYTSDILKSNIFYLTANCLKTNTFLTESTMTMSIRLMKELNAIQDPQNLMIRHGFVDYMIQILKMKNLQTEDYIAMLTILKRQQQKTIFPPHLSTKIFQIVIKNLQSHWKDQMAISSIILLKKIKKNVQITTQFAHNMYEFFNKFLMQSSKVTSYQYYSISRQVICLISYFVNFNEQVKSMFRNKVIIEILKVWLKTFKNIEEQESAQTFRLWMYSVYNDQAFHYDICAINQNRMEQIEKRFEKGWKCNLFRMDGSYKTALFKYSKNYQQVQAFKYPQGEVKSKYRLPLKNILVLYRYKNQQQLLFGQSRFKRTINPFQHQVNPLNCLTIFCLIEERYEVREISIQIQNKLELEEVYSFLKIILNKMVELQREEEIKLWAIRASKQFRLVK